jgi:hypothetical protein
MNCSRGSQSAEDVYHRAAAVTDQREKQEEPIDGEIAGKTSDGVGVVKHIHLQSNVDCFWWVDVILLGPISHKPRLPG